MKKISSLFYLFVVFSISSCGFKPIYKSSSVYNNVASATEQIVIPPIEGFDGRNGIELRNKLYSKLSPYGKSKSPKYILEIYINKPNITSYTTKNDGTTSSYLVKLEAQYKLKRKSDYSILLDTSSVADTTYNVLQNQFSTEVLKEDAINLVIENISQQIYFAIITYFSENR